MNTITQRSILLISFINLIILLCTPPPNPFDDIDNIRLEIEIPEKPDGYKYCINDKVRFKVTVLFADMVKKISIHFDENGDKDEKEITADTSNTEVIFFEYEYKEKGLKYVKFSLTFRQSSAGRDTVFNIDIGVKPTIRNGKNLLVGSEIILGKPLILTVEHDEFNDAEYKWYKDSKLLSGQDKQSLIFNPLKKGDEGQYHCIVTTEWGKDQSKPFNLSFKKKVPEPPKIKIGPQSIQATAGNTARFVVRAHGEIIKYQWQKNGVDIPGANDSLLEVNDLGIGDSATYRCIISNNAGNDTSANAVLKVVENKIVPQITKHPESLQVEEGDTARFLIESYGTDLKYKWFREDKEIANAYQALLEISPVSNSDNGKTFQCLVYNSEGEQKSEKVTLIVKRISKPVISIHPKDTSVTEGTPVMFTVNAAGKSLTYQWFENGIKLTGETNNKLTITAQKGNDKKEYSCNIRNTTGFEVESKPAVLSVYYIEIISPPAPQSVKVGEKAVFKIIASGNPSTIKYQWRKGNVNVGFNSSTYTILKADIIDNGTDISCIVSNGKVDPVSSNSVMLTVEDKPPVIKNELENVRIEEGKSVSFSIDAVGTNLKYQWQKNGYNIDNNNARTEQYTFNVSSGDDGKNFLCVVSNSADTKESNTAILTVLYRVTYDKNNGSGSLPSKSLYAKGESVLLPRLTKPGHEFEGWSIEDDETAEYDPNTNYIMKSKSVTLFAIWKKKKYTITYNNTKPSIVVAVPSGGEYEFGHKIEVLGLEEPDICEWEFQGWEYIGSNQPLQKGDMLEIKNNVTLTTKWVRYTMKDPDGIVTYNCVKIGNQIWMQENYRYTGVSSLELDNYKWFTRGGYWKEALHSYYDNLTSKSHKEKYGALYNWHVVTKDNFTPTGWKVPSQNDFEKLFKFIKNKGLNVAKALASTDDWEASDVSGSIGNNKSQNNKSKFTALPGGWREESENEDIGAYDLFGSWGFWWTSHSSGGWSNTFELSSYKVSEDLGTSSFIEHEKAFGCSIRLIKK